MKKENIKKIVKDNYSNIAKTNGGCCSCSCGKNDAENISKSIGYSDEEMENTKGANLGLGCGNPLALSDIKEGEVVVDLGSGAGIDALLASRRVGTNGKVIGVDFSREMIRLAEKNIQMQNIENVKFVYGDIEKLPLEKESVDVIISNCVINLAPDKDKVFKEAYRILRKNGRMFISDIVLLSPLTKEQKDDKELISGCVAGALLKEDYISRIKSAGFNIEIMGEDKGISKRQYNGINLESLKIKAVKSQ